jgi:hypothetical protein
MVPSTLEVVSGPLLQISRHGIFRAVHLGFVAGIGKIVAI